MSASLRIIVFGRRALSSSSAAAAAAAAPTAPVRPPSSGGGGGAPRTYDWKPVLPPQQSAWAPSAGAHPLSVGAWRPGAVRPGMPMLKCGMTCDYDAWGVRRALTVLRAEAPVVVGHATAALRGYDAVAVGAGTAKRPRAPARGAARASGLAAAGRAPPAVTAEFRVSADALAALPVGAALGVRHWVPGQFVDVRGTSQGKGFQGGMKRWGFAGQPASHGNSVSHRALGATGCRQDPGRVFKGKKMPGRMGGDTVCTQALRVYKVDVARGLVFVEGAVPGKPGGYVRVTDAAKKPWTPAFQPPYPTAAPVPDDERLARAWAALLPTTGRRVPPPAGPLPPPFELVVPPPAVDPFSIAENEEGEEV